FCPSAVFGCAGSIFQVDPFTTNLYWTALPYGIVTSAFQTPPDLVIGVPVAHATPSPKSPRTSTEDSPWSGYVIVYPHRSSSSGQIAERARSADAPVASSGSGAPQAAVATSAKLPRVSVVARRGRRRERMGASCEEAGCPPLAERRAQP